MKESLRLSLDQKLQQRMSPAQIRFVRLLEMGETELEEEVKNQVEENPALEVVDELPADSEPADGKAEYDDLPSYRLNVNNRSADDAIYEPVAVAAPMSLLEYLSSQVNEMNVPEDVAAVADYIIGNIDDNGYLTRTLQSIADDVFITTGMDIPMDTYRRGLDLVKTLDPAGVGAVDLRECLLLQLRRLSPDEDVNRAIEIVNHYFDLFSLKHYDRLASMLSITMEQLRKAIHVIRSLNPKPGAEIGGSPSDERTGHVVPDFYIETDEALTTVTVIMPSGVPDLRIEESFKVETADDKADAFISRRRNDALEFIDMLRMRRTTLFNIMSAIVKIQHEFFLTEDETTLRPMVLKDIGAITGYDLSVISRATSGKYVATATSIYPLKYFFNEGVAGSDDDTSTHACMSAIREIIEGEDPASPLSDDTITSQLESRGFKIARRTVAKYRERLGFPAARLRKKL
ncbi:MAG: RNA polymerase factor sigma-54 [Lachnoclostridium sp.]|nr:RNA polymerase factor sigma-54 [Lachnoclostridium sp.]